MINLFVNFIFYTFLSTIIFSFIVMLSMHFGTTKAHPPYYKVEGDNIYVVYKYVRSGGKNSYKTCKFRLEGDKFVFLKEKLPFPFDLIIPEIIILLIINKRGYSILRLSTKKVENNCILKIQFMKDCILLGLSLFQTALDQGYRIIYSI